MQLFRFVMSTTKTNVVAAVILYALSITTTTTTTSARPEDATVASAESQNARVDRMGMCASFCDSVCVSTVETESKECKAFCVTQACAQLFDALYDCKNGEPECVDTCTQSCFKPESDKCNNDCKERCTNNCSGYKSGFYENFNISNFKDAVANRLKSLSSLSLP